MEQNYLSDIELYYSNIKNDNIIILTNEEHRHIAKVMRHNVGDNIFVTDGSGSIYKTVIEGISKNEVLTRIIATFTYENELSNFIVCFPRLKSADRFSFALEKCVELGFTKFIVYQADRSVAKGEKIDRWQKIAISAMKQSLRSFLPQIEFVKSVKSLNVNGELIYFDQNATANLTNYSFTNSKSYTIVFGPEGGYSEKETEFLKQFTSLKLTPNRLRAETAVVTAAAYLSIN